MCGYTLLRVLLLTFIAGYPKAYCLMQLVTKGIFKRCCAQVQYCIACFIIKILSQHRNIKLIDLDYHFLKFKTIVLGLNYFLNDKTVYNHSAWYKTRSNLVESYIMVNSFLREHY